MLEAYLYAGAVLAFVCWIGANLLGAKGRQEFRIRPVACVTGLLSVAGMIFFLVSLLVPPLWQATFPAPLVVAGAVGVASLLAMNYAG